MARNKPNNEEAFGSDSFLDIVANMVGILIVLVLVAGLRARNVKHLEPPPDADQQAAHAAAAQEAENIESDTRRLEQELHELQIVTDARRNERDSMLMLASAAQAAIDQRRDQLSAHQREEFDLRRQLAESESRLKKLSAELQTALQDTSSSAIKIDNYPTPISHTVTGHEIHFQLLHGRVSYVPLDQLVNMLRRDFERKVTRLQDVTQATETIGPVAGFRLRYTMSRVQVNGRVGAQVSQFTLLPLPDLPSESLDDIRRDPGSDFRRVLTAAGPRNVTITFWVYPDSFAAYRELKKDLYAAGFSVAGRPLPEGQPIGGSPDGTKSSAQ